MNEKPAQQTVTPSNCSEHWISWILRVGVSASLLLILIGIVVCFWHHPQYLSSKSELGQLISSDADFPRTLSGVFAEVLAFRGPAIITVGLLLLIATPIARIAISIIGFIGVRDYVFAIITSFVLLIVLMSFLLGKIQ
jgi:uncharacterized membrane protein